MLKQLNQILLRLQLPFVDHLRDEHVLDGGDDGDDDVCEHVLAFDDVPDGLGVV